MINSYLVGVFLYLAIQAVFVLLLFYVIPPGPHGILRMLLAFLNPLRIILNQKNLILVSKGLLYSIYGMVILITVYLVLGSVISFLMGN